MQFKQVGFFLDKFKSGGKMNVADEFMELTKAQQTAVLSSSALSATQKQLLLENTGLAASQVATTASTTGQAVATGELAASQATATASTTGFSAAMSGLCASIKSTFLALATNPLTWVAAASVAFAALMDAMTVDYSEANETFQISSQNYQDTKTNLESLNSEFETTKNRISELQALKDAGTITLAQQSELESLQSQNVELERKIQLEERLLSIQSKEAINDAKVAMDKKDHSVAQSVKMGDSTGKSTFKETVRKTTDSIAIKDDLALIEEYEKSIPELEEKVAKLKEELSGKNLFSKDGYLKDKLELNQAEKELEQYQESLNTLYSDIDEKSANIQNQLDIFKLDPEANKAVIQELEETLDSIVDSSLTASGKAAEALSEIWEDDSFAKNQQQLVDALRSGKDISVKDIARDFPELTAACEEAGVSVETLRDELIALSSQSGAVTKLEDDFNSFKNSLVSAINSIDTINSSLASSFSGKGLSVEFDEETGVITGDIENIKKAFQDLDGYDASVLFEKTANGIHLNREALRELQAQQESLQKKTNLEKIIDLQNRLNQAIAERDSKKEGSDDYNAAEIAVNNLENQLEIAKELAAAYDGATSAYQKWVNTQSNGEEGDMFRSVSETMRERGSELYKEGRYNTNEFRAIADYFSNQDLSTASVEELVRAYEAAKPMIDSFFTGGKDGIDRFVASMKQLSDSENLGWVEELDNGKLKFNTGSDEEIAERFGISKEAIQALYRAMTEYTDDFVIGDTSGIQDFSASIDEMKQKADEAKSHLKELSNSNLDLNFNFDNTNIDELDSQIEKAKSNLDQFKNQDGNVDLSINGAEDAITILQTLIQQKQIVSQPEIMSIDTSSLNEGVATVIAKLQEYQTAVNELSSLQEMQSVGIQIDTSQIDEAKSKVDSVFSEIQNMSSEGNLQINADVSVDASSMDSLNSTLASMTPEIKAKITSDKSALSNADTSSTAKVNYEKGEQAPPDDMPANVNYKKGTQDPPSDMPANVNYKKGEGQEEPSDKTAKVNYNKGKQGKPDKKTAKVDYKKGKQDKPSSPKTAVINYKLGTVAKPPSVTVKVNYDTSGAPKSDGKTSKKSSKKSDANGTAHANGSMNYGSSMYHHYRDTMRPAHAGGKWGLKKNENGAIINELGGEIIVRDGQWFILNDGYPTLANLKQNDIIFNHKQSEQILKNGYVTGSHAKLAYSGGSAFSSGSWTMGNIGGGNLNGSGSYSANSGNKNSSASSNTADAISDTNDKAEEFKETLDSIEILIDRIERQIKNLERVAGSAFNTFEKRNSTLRQQMSSITQEIAIQQQGYDRYLQEANSVGLSEEYKNLVMNGAIDISTITDKTLSKNIQEFKQWYEKALNCRDAVEELKESVRELYKEAFDNVVTLYDGMLSQIEHRRNMLEGYIDQTEAQGYIVSTKYYNALISNEQNNLSKLTKERNDLINAMNDAIANGGIEMYSEQWYDFQQEINSVNEAIQDANTSIIEFKNSIREIEWDIFDKIQDRISGITDEADFLVKVMSDEDMYDDKGVVTKHGTATYGLHGVNYNVYMSQADQYKKEMKSIEMELSKDPYNQTLIERRKELLELQQESILAAEDEKQAIKSLVEEGIQKQLDALKELIDKYNDALDSQKDMYDYQKNIDKQQKKVNSLEKQWIAYQGDDSEEGSVKRQQTWNDLEEARAELEETQYEKYISDQKKLLDELYTEYETVLNMRLDNLDQLIASVIEGVNAEGSNIRDTLISESEKVGYTLTNSMETIWGASGTIASILTTYSSNFSSIMTSVQEAINAIKIAIQNAISASNKNASDNISKIDRDQAQQTARPTTSNTPSTSINTNTNNNGGDGVPRIGDKVTYVKDRYYASSSGANPSGYQMLGQSVYITSINNASWAKKPYHISRGPTLGNGDLGWVTLDQLQGYRTGKPIIDKNQLAWTQENGDELVLGRSDGAILTPLKRGDAVVNKKGTDQVVEFARNPKAFVGKSLSELTQEMPIMKNEGVGNTIQNDIHMSIGIDHVEGYNDFVTQLQKDHQFEKFIQTITTDRIMGKGSLGKYNVRFR